MKEDKTMAKELKDYVVTIPDFPKPGIMFRDVSAVLADKDGLKLAIDGMQKELEGLEFDAIAGTESRGFIFGMPLAYNLNKPFILIRKKGKLPREVESIEYDLEYGRATLEIHKDDLKKGSRVVLVDDLIATGGTLEAAIKLVESVGGKVVKIVVLMELQGLNGRSLLEGYDVASVLKYEGK